LFVVAAMVQPMVAKRFWCKFGMRFSSVGLLASIERIPVTQSESGLPDLRHPVGSEFLDHTGWQLSRIIRIWLGSHAGYILMTHSMGTMVAYDVLRNCDGCPPVDTLFTLGSPLGVKEF
jgi:hypothetical protein